jgi:hypothetical protein
MTVGLLKNPDSSRAVDLSRHAIWSANIILDNVDRVFDSFVKVKFNPADAPLSARQQWLVPYSNKQALVKLIEQTLGKGLWAKRKGSAKQWKAFLGKLHDNDERATARSLKADYVYSGKLQHGFIKIDQKRKVFVETVLLSDYFRVLNRPLPPASAKLQARLKKSGLFRVKAGCYSEPHTLARVIKATAFFKNLTDIAGVEPRQKPKMLAAAFKNLRQVDKVAGFAPQLFESVLQAGTVVSWMVTPEGKRVLSGVSLPKGSDTSALKKAATVLRRTSKRTRGSSELRRLGKLAVRSHADTSNLMLLFQWPHFLVGSTESDQKFVQKLLKPGVRLQFSAANNQLVLGP